MRTIYTAYSTSQPGGRMWLPPVLLGVSLILFGLLILAMPELLAFLVAGAIIVGGSSLIGLGLTLRAAGRRTESDVFEIR